MIELDREFVQNPHDLYRRLRISGPATPVVIWGGTPVWLITRYAEAKNLLNDPRLSKNHASAMALFPPGTGHHLAGSINATMLMSDPPDHTRLRKIVMKAFTPRTVEALRPRVVCLAEDLLDQIDHVAADGPVDLIETFAAPLPMQVIGELLGVPVEYRDNFRAAVQPMLTRTDDEQLSPAAATLTSLLTALIALKRQRPADDLLSALVKVSEDGDRLSEGELLAMTYLLIVAGYETTMNLIGNGTLAMLQNPSQLAALRADPSAIPAAVEELLRFESPVNIATLRFTAVPISVGGVPIPANEFVMIALLAANRDGDRFPNPDRLDISRNANPHIAFGHGIHHCVGAPLARLEGEVALGRLFARFPRIERDDTAPLEYRGSSILRGLKALPVRLWHSAGPSGTAGD